MRWPMPYLCVVYLDDLILIDPYSGRWVFIPLEL